MIIQPKITANSADYGWLLTHNSSNSNNAWYVHYDGDAHEYFSTYDVLGVEPTLYLSPDVNIEGGSGTSSSPYTLSFQYIYSAYI